MEQSQEATIRQGITSNMPRGTKEVPQATPHDNISAISSQQILEELRSCLILKAQGDHISKT